MKNDHPSSCANVACPSRQSVLSVVTLPTSDQQQSISPRCFTRGLFSFGKGGVREERGGGGVGHVVTINFAA
jgi:hypothetical protein